MSYAALDEQAVVAVLSAPEWRERSTAALARHLGLAPGTVARLRKLHRLMPRVVKDAQGHVMLRRFKRKLPALTPEQQALMADAYPMAQRRAKQKANLVLNEDDLLGLAHDALVVAVRHWQPLKQSGAERTPGSKWRAYAANGIKQAFRRAFKNRRVELKRTALLGSHPYQRWTVATRLLAAVDEGREHETRSGAAVPDKPQRTELFARFERMVGIHKTVIEGVAGLDGKEPWDAAALADNFGIGYDEASALIESAKQELLGA